MGDDNVVPFPEHPPGSWGRIELDARELARLGALSEIDYERCNHEAAKKLGIRMQTLDRMVKRIRCAGARWVHKVGDALRFYDDDLAAWGFLVTASRIWNHREEFTAELIVLADGNGTPVWVGRRFDGAHLISGMEAT